MSKPRSSRRRPVATYEYCDQRGHLVYVLARYHPKDFEWLRSDLRPWTARRRRPLLYRLPELLEAKPNRMVFVAEGEKDVDRLRSLGLVATCNDNGGGRAKWHTAHSRHLRGRHVVVLPDNDATGEQHAQDVARRLVRFAASVRILPLPNLPRKGDVSDWLDAGGTKQELLQLAKAAPLWNEVPPYDPPRNEEHHWRLAHELSRIIGTDLSPPEKLLLIILADFAKRPPPQATLAVWLGVTERRVRQLVATLSRRGVLSVSRIGRTNRYDVRSINRQGPGGDRR